MADDSLAKMTDEELINRRTQTQDEMAAAKMKAKFGQFKKTTEFPKMRKEVARINTALRQREIAKGTVGKP
ncbi:MAG: 50S ribosomal protein L29 [Deltaproteobacteria bacterium CG11_big_fil_rev_8_21_14_0_20_45_16]|nr:MAG: 50S ribosomal protein L29 [Deltaproteobacteria bacterium CG11_big_fil_rev_8_21_14_0_20_45_16]